MALRSSDTESQALGTGIWRHLCIEPFRHTPADEYKRDACMHTNLLESKLACPFFAFREARRHDTEGLAGEFKGRGAEHNCWAAQLATEAQRWLACAQRRGTALAAYAKYAPRRPMQRDATFIRNMIYNASRPRIERSTTSGVRLQRSLSQSQQSLAWILHSPSC